MSKPPTGSDVSRRAFLATTATVAAATAAASTSAAIAAVPALGKKPRWGFLIDLRRCIGCKACTVACKTEFDVRLGVFRSSVKEHETGAYPNAKRSFLPWLCNHCETPVCLRDCPVDEMEASFTFPDGRKDSYRKRATYRRPDGAVLIDQKRCIGCGNCVEACPYKVRYMDPVKDVADKCSLCVHRLDAGIVPSCVNTCQGDARMAGDLNDSGSEISRIIREEGTQVIRADFGTKPQCFYIGLDPKAFDEGRDVI
jgi:tetrathionate reductase subunit B